VVGRAAVDPGAHVDEKASPVTGSAQPNFVIDVVVPVYNAPDDVRTCIGSVLAHLRPDVRVVLIDDASPDPAIAPLFEELASRAHPQLVLLRNDTNLGFTGTANRGMQLSRADVILLNSDTIVSAGWLDAIMHCSATDPRIGTITPFSNNAEICSFPRFCENNPWPRGAHPDPTNASIAAAAVPVYPDLPTGVGFCLYLRRALLDEIGYFDAEAFGAGYGEENDLCLRAAKAGWRNVLADNAFVVHTGERSFAGRKAEVAQRNMAALLERHPYYMDMVREFIAADPLRAIRELALMRIDIDAALSRGVLHIVHHHGGGTESHVRALVEGSKLSGWRHYIAIAVEDRWQIEAHGNDGTLREFELVRDESESWASFVGGVAASLGITLIHLHNISGCRNGILEALPQLPIPVGYTIHDLNCACPTITMLHEGSIFCGGVTDAATCARCLERQAEFEHIDIVQWRERHRPLVTGAAFRIAPSKWAATMTERYFPGAPVDVVAHGVIEEDSGRSPGARPVLLLPADDVPTVAVLGAIGPDKGARRLERLVELARQRKARVRFVLIGYLDFQHGPWQSDDALFSIHGHYATRDLADLLDHYRVALVLYPSAGPETFSFTLTEAWKEGRPALVPPIGALAERVEGSGAGWVMSDAEWRDEARMLERIEQVLSSDDALAAAAQAARAMPRISTATMARRTLAHYEEAIAGGAPLALRPLEKGRILYALGYRPWRAPTGPWRKKSTSFLARVQRAALRRQAKLADRLSMRFGRLR
jgi:GT2 family glycosyltransferase/glycosyltransferase involved in cell wall biosynthesis